MIYHVKIDWWDGTQTEERLEWRWASDPKYVASFEWLRFREMFLNRLGYAEPYPMQIRAWEETGRLVFWVNNEHVPETPLIPTPEQQKKLDFYKTLYASQDETPTHREPLLAVPSSHSE